MLLQIKNLSVKASHSNAKLLDSISCSVDAGQILAIIGPNGAGKSTLLKAVSGDCEYSGEICISGLCDEPKLRARQLAVLPQLSLLNFPFRVSEVVNLARIPHQTGLQRDQEVIAQALDLMDIGFLAERLYTELSGGEKQRVQLARVLAQIWHENDSPAQTRMLVLDEPTTALDLGHQQDLMTAVQQFAKQGVAVLMVLHDINLATRYADKVLALQCSQTAAYGEPHEVITADNLKRLFGVDTEVIKHPVHGTPVVVGL